MLDESFELS